MATGPSRCIYALRPVDRPGCQLTATVTYGAIALCSACDARRSTLGEGQTRRRLPDTPPDPIALLADAHLHLIDAHELSFPSNRGGFFNDGLACWPRARVSSRRCLR
jgi:hypothetical protein